MKTPTWAYVVGILFMLFGGCTASKSVQNINMPAMLELQKEMMGTISQSSDAAAQEMTDQMMSMMDVSEYTMTWTVRFGYIGAVVAIVYILGGVFLMVKRPFSIKLAYGALVLSMIFSITQMMVLTSDTSGGFFSQMAGFGHLFGVVIDVILLVVIIAMDKSAYVFPQHEVSAESVKEVE